MSRAAKRRPAARRSGRLTVGLLGTFCAMRGRRAPWVALLLALLSACGTPTAGQSFGPAPHPSTAAQTPSSPPPAAPSSVSSTPPPKPVLTPAGNPNGHAAIPAEARAEDTSHPTRVI